MDYKFTEYFSQWNYIKIKRIFNLWAKGVVRFFNHFSPAGVTFFFSNGESHICKYWWTPLQINWQPLIDFQGIFIIILVPGESYIFVQGGGVTYLQIFMTPLQTKWQPFTDFQGIWVSTEVNKTQFCQPPRNKHLKQDICHRRQNILVYFRNGK